MEPKRSFICFLFYC